MPPDLLISRVETVGWDSCPACVAGILTVDGEERRCCLCEGKGGRRLVRLVPVTEPLRIPVTRLENEP